jgi:hypothetical protein
LGGFLFARHLQSPFAVFTIGATISMLQEKNVRHTQRQVCPKIHAQLKAPLEYKHAGKRKNGLQSMQISDRPGG